jgi:hypothetical protein
MVAPPRAGRRKSGDPLAMEQIRPFERLSLPNPIRVMAQLDTQTVAQMLREDAQRSVLRGGTRYPARAYVRAANLADHAATLTGAN